MQSMNRDMSRGDKEPEPSTPRAKYLRLLRDVGIQASELVHRIDMEELKAHVQHYGGKLDMLNFIVAMQESLQSKTKDGGRSGSTDQPTQHSTQAEGDIYSDSMLMLLIWLFQAMDYNGDEFIELDEVTRYVLDKATGFSSLASVDGNNMIFPYRECQPLGSFLRHRHRECIEHVVPIPRKALLAVIEEQALHIYIYCARTGRVVRTMAAHAAILAIAYIECQHILITSHIDKSLAIWNLEEAKMRERWKERARWSIPTAQIAICYIASQRLLYTGTAAGSMHAWDLCSKDCKASMSGHEGPITCIISLDDIGMLASASRDCTLCVWDAYSRKQRLRLTHGHHKGILSLAYNPSFRILISAGYEHHVCIWSPLVGTLISRLTGHGCPLRTVCTIHDRPELFTADSGSVIKVWDLRSLKCIQTLSKEHGLQLEGLTGLIQVYLEEGDPFSPEARQQRSRLIVASKHLTAIDQVTALRTEPITDDRPITSAVLNDDTLTIVHAAGRSLRIWDAVLGTIRLSIVDACKDEVTAATLDHRKRRILAGDAAGTIYCFAPENGMLMKTGSRPEKGLDGNDAVVQLVHMAGERQPRIVAAFADGGIFIFDDSGSHSMPLLREFDRLQRNQPILTAIALVAGTNLTLLASASSSKGDAIKLWNPNCGKWEGELTLDDLSETKFSVTCLIFLEPLPVLVVGCSDGYFRVWPVGPKGAHGARRGCWFSWQNVLPCAYIASENQQATPSGDVFPRWSAARTESDLAAETAETRSLYSLISKEMQVPQAPWVVCWDAESKVLYSGDEHGNVRSWDLQATCVQVLRKLAAYQQASRVSSASASNAPAANWASRTAKPIGEDTGLASLVRLDWSVQSHTEVVVALVQSKDPAALVSASSDSCCRMWTKQGRPIGMLMRGLPGGTRNPGWSLPLNIEDRLMEKQWEMFRLRAELKERQKYKPTIPPDTQALAQDKSFLRSQRSPIPKTVCLPSATLSKTFTSSRSTAFGLNRASESASLKGRHPDRQSLFSLSPRFSGGGLFDISSPNAVREFGYDAIVRMMQAIADDPALRRNLYLDNTGELGLAQGDGHHKPRRVRATLQNMVIALKQMQSGPHRPEGRLGRALDMEASGEGGKHEHGKRGEEEDEGGPPMRIRTAMSRGEIPMLSTTFKKVAGAMLLLPEQDRRGECRVPFEHRLEQTKRKLQRASQYLRQTLSENDSLSEAISPSNVYGISGGGR